MVESGSGRQIGTRRAALAVFLDRRALVMLALGFSSGLPFLLIFDTLSAWLRVAGVTLDVIGFFQLATLAYAFKFLWAPWVDRTHVPFLTASLGHRRSWMLVAQAATIVGLGLIALSDPAVNVTLVAAFVVVTGFASATQDIVIDAWRIEVASDAEQGAMAAAYQWGYRIAFITAGAAPLLLADLINWHVSYAVMAALMGIGVLAVLLAPRERAHVIRPIPRVPGAARPVVERLEWLARLGVLVAGAMVLGSGLTGRAEFLAAAFPGDVGAHFLAAWRAKPDGVLMQIAAVIAGFGLVAAAAWPLPGKPTQPGVFLSHALGDPLTDFFKRYGREAVLILVLICFYRISEFTLNLMNPFYVDLGFSLTQIAEVRKIYGAVMFLAGVAAGGYAIARWGIMGPLIAGAVAAPLSNLAFAWLTTRGADVPALIVTLGLNNSAQAFAGTCLIAYMSSLTSAGFTATQYALFSSLYALPDKFIGTQSGRIVEAAARSADTGGIFAPLAALLRSSLPPGSLAAGAAKAGVAPASLGAGYMAFFIYTFLIGIAVVPVAFVVAARARRA